MLIFRWINTILWFDEVIPRFLASPKVQVLQAQRRCNARVLRYECRDKFEYIEQFQKLYLRNDGAESNCGGVELTDGIESNQLGRGTN